MLILLASLLILSVISQRPRLARAVGKSQTMRNVTVRHAAVIALLVVGLGGLVQGGGFDSATAVSAKNRASRTIAKIGLGETPLELVLEACQNSVGSEISSNCRKAMEEAITVDSHPPYRVLTRCAR
ncbi:MAG: hypothetical protein AB1540_05530 [Bdellovibrionota bacterium]